MRSRLAVGAALGVLAVCVFSAFHPALAQSAASQLSASATAAGASTTPLPIVIARVIRVFLGTLGIIFTLVVLYAGWTYMTAQGDDTKLKKAKDMIRNGVIGMALCLFSFVITSYILGRLLGSYGGTGTSTSVVSQYSEPLSGSLGAGIIESHYPERNAIAIPRNTRIMVKFKEGIDPASIISGWNPDLAADATGQSSSLNAANVIVSRPKVGSETEDSTLGTEDVTVTTVKNADGVYVDFVFDPVPLLGTSTDDTNYTVALANTILKADGRTAAFSGSYSGGYEWTFEVSTEVDLTPPRIVSVIPRESGSDARNVTLAITFNEAMDPVAGTGTYTADADDANSFGNITVDSTTLASGYHVDGSFSISNGYKTIEFTPTEACGVDPCGDTIYCLPATANGSDDTVTVTSKAANVSLTDAPQAVPVGVSFDGLVDAAANSLDGDKDGIGEGPSQDTASWTNTIRNEINDTIPHITEMHPDIREEEADNASPVTVTFSTPMKSSTLTSTNVSLWPDPWYEFWFRTGKTDLLNEAGDALSTTAELSHPVMVSVDDLGWAYDPVVTRDVKSSYQICMFTPDGPAVDETSESDRGSSATRMCATTFDGSNASASFPYCCNGVRQATRCQTVSDNDANELTAPVYYNLPDSDPTDTSN